MATTAARRTIPFKVNTGVKVGQGELPQLWALYSTDDLNVPVPTWVDATADVRSFDTGRGRDNEQSEIDAGHFTVVLGNRSRTYDPVVNPAIRPMNRWWIREQFSGETQDIIKGYADAYEQSWPGGGWSDAETTVTGTDEFKVLALGHLPTTTPPRNTYAEVVEFDTPQSYWPITFSDSTQSQVVASTGGKNLAGLVGANAFGTPIIGQPEDLNGYVLVGNSAPPLSTGELVQGEAGDVAGLAEFTIEFWFAISVLPGATIDLAAGPNAGGASTWRVRINTVGQIVFEARNSAGTLFTATSSALIASGTDPTVVPPWNWTHVVCVIQGSAQAIYLNGVLNTTAGFTAPFAATIDATQAMTVGDATFAGFMYFDEMAFYRHGVSGTRIAAHYQAGTQRGFARSKFPNERANSVLDAVGSTAPRRFGYFSVNSRGMTGSYMVGQAPLDELRAARDAENIDAMLFIGRDGAVVFLDRNHRAGSPWDTVQATFGDGSGAGAGAVYGVATYGVSTYGAAGGSELPYLDLVEDYSESFLANEWNVTTVSGLLQTASDTASISRYFKRPQSISGLPVTDDGQAALVASGLLAKTKDPMPRITQIVLTTHTPAVTEAVFRRDLGDRISVLRTPPGSAYGGGAYGGGAYGSGPRLEQTLFIQKITIQGSNETPGLWTINWAVSPV